MTQKTECRPARVGDAIAWADVPDGAMVRTDDGSFYVERPTWRYRVHTRLSSFWARETSAQPERAKNTAERVTVIALSLTGKETAGELRALTERFDIRKMLRVEPGLPGFSRVYLEAEMLGGFSGGDGLSYWAERLHAAGWRVGGTAADAARLLAGTG